jgi:hypothetical protein
VLLAEAKAEKDEAKFNQILATGTEAIASHMLDHRHLFLMARHVMKRGDREQLGWHIEAA